MQKIEVILLQDVKKLGKKYDVVKVAPVYARNVLLPSMIAKFATPGAMHDLNKKIESNKKHAETVSEKIKHMISDLQENGLTISVEANEQQKLYWHIHPKDIAQTLSEKYGFDVDENWINIHEIELLGSYPVTIDWHATKWEFNLDIAQK